MSKHRAFVALGSNLGNKEKNIKQALKLLEEQGIEIVKVSTLIVTEPYGVLDQPGFLNGVCEIKTELEPLELLRLLLATEQQMGRVRLRHWGERNIDLDMIFYENIIMDTQELKLPHPDMQNRDFVLLPMTELAPSLVHPVLKKTMAELKEELLQHD